jgi:glycosyltransferase involved in cell wall biosynthesis
MKLSILIPLYNRKDTIARAIQSIPKRKDIEIIVCDDGSDDDCLNEVLSLIEYEDYEIKTLRNELNKGVGYTMNKLYDNANGEYVLPLGSDDYFYSGKLEEFIKELDGTDMVYFNMKSDDGYEYVLDNESKNLLVGSTKATRREFLGDTRCPEIRKEEDYSLYQELQKKNPTEKFTNIVLKHYTTNRNDRLSTKEE